MSFRKLEHSFISVDNTCVFEDSEFKYGSPTEFLVTNVHTGQTIQEVKFQTGPINDTGVNGIFNEDLLVMVLRRLECFQNSEMNCAENEYAIMHIKEAINWLNHRTADRKKRKVINTYNK